MNGVDTGKLEDVRPDLRPLATVMAEGNREVRDIGDTLPNADKQEWLDNHFKHYFEDNTDGSSFGENWFTNQGSAASLQHRSFPTYADAEKAGYHMAQWVKDDPIRAYLEYQNGIRAYQKDTLLKQSLVDDGLGVWIGKGDTTHPMRSLNLEGMAPLNGRTGGPATGNRILMVPEDMARLYNNSVSKSFAFWPEGAEAADMLQRTSNSFNMMLLAGPLFHGSMTMGESMVNQLLMGVAHAASGNWSKAGREAIQAPIAPYIHYTLGAELNKVALNPALGSPALQAAVHYLTRARASFGKNYDPSMQFTNQRSFIESIQAGSLTKEWNAAKNRVIESDSRGKQAVQAMGEVSGLIGKTLKTIAAPLFDHVIPNIKSGINAQQLMAWMEANKGANDTEIVKAAQRITDNTDNTLGEMRYDNLFWNKTMTQIMQTFVLAPSYTAGYDPRRWAAAPYRRSKIPNELVLAQKILTRRAAYVVAFAASS